MNTTIFSNFESIPESRDRSARGPLAFYWDRRVKALTEYSEIADRVAVCLQSLEAHKKHFRSHPADRRAAVRLAKLVLQIDELSPGLGQVRDQFAYADNAYRVQAIRFADIPSEFLEGVETQILDTSGTVRVVYGRPLGRGERIGCTVLYSNGAVHHVRTPFDTVN